MMEEANPPFPARTVERAVEPFDLLPIGRMVTVQCDEARVPLIERVAIDVAHVERLEMNLQIAIVVAERRVELHAALEEWLVRNRKLVCVVVVIQVVAEHED